MTHKGKITSWNEAKGFRNQSRRPQINQRVAYDISTDSRGRPCATNATMAGPPRIKRKNIPLSLITAALFLVIIGICTVTAKIPAVFLVVYLLVSLFTFVLYAVDKSAARKGAWRIKENTLHLLSLAGGWPGALIAQTVFRHKSKKPSFRIVFLATVLINCTAFIWLAIPAEFVRLESFISRLL